MTFLAALGFGYCVRHLVAEDRGAFARVVGTARTPERLAALPVDVEGLLFDGRTLEPGLAAALAEARILIVSTPPDEAGDPVLRCAAEVLARGRLAQVVYLATVGVYGDHGGAWVDETTIPRPGSARLERRLAAEAQWQAFGREKGIPVAVLRLAGIYGPGRSALDQVREGTARRIAKPGQVFNRIHVADIAGAIRAAVAQGFDGLLNVADDLPAPSGDPLAFAAELLGVAPPPEISFTDASRGMSPMALSFWDANKRVGNARLKETLGVRLRYPTYREGLAALHAADQARSNVR